LRTGVQFPPPPPILYFLVTIITLSSLITKTWGFLLAKPLADKLKLLWTYTVSLTVTSSVAGTSNGVTAHG